MFQRTPVCAAVAALLVLPWTPGHAQQAEPAAGINSAESAGSDVAKPAEVGGQVVRPRSLRDVEVKGQAEAEFNATYNSLSKLPADTHDIAQSITVVNKALMQSQGATSLADALRNVPGITMSGAEGGQIGNNINLNGFAARTDIYFDGMRDRGQYYRDLFALDSIEVLMGPSSMLFGRGSTGGAINQVSKKPSLRQAGEFSASLSSNGLVRTTADYNQPLSETSAFRIAAMAQDGKPGTRDEMTVKDFGLAPSLRFGIGTPTTVTLSALMQRNRDMPDYGLNQINSGPAGDVKTMYGYTSDRTISEIGAFNAVVEHKLTPTTSIRNQTQMNRVYTDALETAPNAIGTVGANGFTATPTTTLPLSALFVRLQGHDRIIRDSSIYNQTELTTKLQTGTFSHNLLTGIELGVDSYRNQATYRNGSCNGVPLNAVGATTGYTDCTPLLDYYATSSPGTIATQQGNLQTGHATTLAAYVNDTIDLSTQFKLNAGLRFDHYSANIANSINSANTNTTPPNTTLPKAEQTINHVSYRLGGIWQPSAAQSYYVSYGTSFNPSLEQLTATTGQQNLDPETNKSYEVGGKWDMFDGDLALNAAAFQITKDNARTLVSPGVYALAGDVRVRGIRTGASGRITTNWQVFGGYTYLDGKVVKAADGTQGNVPANTPKHTLSLWTTYAFAPRWEVGGGAYYMSSRYVVPANTVQVAGYTRWDTTLAYRERKYDVRLNVFNLFNKGYFDGIIQSDGGRSVPGIGRTALLSFTYRM